MTTAQLTLAEVNQFLKKNRDILEQASSKQGASLTAKNPDVYFQRIVEELKTFEETVRKVNYRLLTKKQDRLLRKTFIKKLFPHTEKLAVIIIADGFERAWSQSCFPNDSFTAVVRNQASRYARAEVDRILGRNNSVEPEPIPTPAPLNLTFPELAKVNYQVDRGVKELREAWQKAIKHAGLNDEDQFLLQRVVTDYLPDTWRMYNTVSDMPRSVTDKATAMLHSQVTALLERVKVINSTHGEAALKELRAQTSFINQKRPRKSISQTLHLS